MWRSACRSSKRRRSERGAAAPGFAGTPSAATFPIRDSASRTTSPSEKPSEEPVMFPPPDDHSILSVPASRPARRRDQILRVVGWVLLLTLGVAMLGLGAATLYARSSSGRER